MYRLNRTNRNVLITPDEVLFHSPSTGEEGERQILNNIIVAEERFVANALGFEFYEHIIGLKNVEVTEANKADLITKLKEGYQIDFDDNIVQVGMIVNAIEFVDDEWIKKLWKQYLWKITAECVELMTIVPSWLQTTKAGQQMQNPKTIGSMDQKSASGERNDIKFKMDNALLERIEPMTERMHQWLCRNKIHFPLYKKSCEDSGCFDGDRNEDVISKTGFAFGHYD